MSTKLSFILLFWGLCQSMFSQSDNKTLFFISDSHLDTQWNWDVTTTIDQYILNTMNQNFVLFDKYPSFQFNFESAIHYMWMKEYYPTEFARLKEYIQNNRWQPSGGSINANDVMVPSAESIIRNFLYGQTWYKKEFGKKGGRDIMLPDCFGFPYSLPTLSKHCGVIGFHTQKLAWGSAYDYNSLPPFGIWKGVDGSEIYAIFKGEDYSAHEQFNKDMSADQDMLNTINSHLNKYGIPAAFRYVGPRGDRGGGLQDNPEQAGENTPYWLERSMQSNGAITVKLASPDEAFELLSNYRNDKYVVWDNELPMQTHGTGCYTSHAIMKYWNRKNELLADAVEKSAVFADWLGGLKYPADRIRNSWIRLLWHQFHDDLTGTSIPNAYNFSHNDEILVNSDFAHTLLNSVGAIAKQLDTRTVGIPLIVYNPLSIRRVDIVEASIITTSRPSGIRIADKEGKDMLTQITDYDSNTGKLSFIFQATLPALGYAVYDLLLNENTTVESSLKITDNSLENNLYIVTLNNKGDVASIYDKEQNLELLTDAIRLTMLNDRSETWPSWEIMWDNVNTSRVTYIDDNVNISIAEKGPLRVSLKISRTKNNSEFVQYIRLADSAINERIDFVNEVNWQSKGTMLKAIFPLRANNTKAAYDLSIGAIERGVNTPNLYEVAGHQWADQTHSDGTYGISILNDCKYGWDKPNNATLRLTLIHTPETKDNYTYQKDQDLGLNKFTYSFYRHIGAWNEKTQWEASKLNQPLLAFLSPKHTGKLGKSFEPITLNTNKIAVKALKKAEDSDEIILRVYELTGKDLNDVAISFPSDILSIYEVNGIEEKIKAISPVSNSILFDIGKYQPKTFAIKLANPADTLCMANPSSVKVDLTYNIDVMSFDEQKNNVTSGVTYAYPAELFDDFLTVNGIEFSIGNRNNGYRNAVQCTGQTITLPALSDSKKIYLLAASRNEKGSVADFIVDTTTHTFSIPYYAKYLGNWETEYCLATQYPRENVAFTATHRHNVANRQNESYRFLHIYQYTIPTSETPSTLVLPNNRDVYLFAITLSNNENDLIIPATEINSFPEYIDTKINTDNCTEKLIHKSATASHQNGDMEGPEKAVDDDPNTKWCVTNNASPWLEISFEMPVEICRWFILNAGNESFNYITSNCRLQNYENRRWTDIDVVQNNTLNKIDRTVNPFITSRVRLQIDKGEQNGNTTRILEFSVFGNKDNALSIQSPATTNKKSLYIMGNIPNPLDRTTTIQYLAPQNITKLNLHIYNMLGKQVYTNAYLIDPDKELHEIVWNNQSLDDGMYLYSFSATDNGKSFRSNAKKMIINRSGNQ